MNNLFISESIKSNMLKSAKWLKFFTVFSAIGMGFAIVCAIFMLIIPDVEGLPGFIFSIFYTITACLSYYPIKKGFNIVKNIRASMTYDSQEALEKAAEDTGKTLRYCGILFITSLILYTLFVIVLIGILAFSAYD